MLRAFLFALTGLGLCGCLTPPELTPRSPTPGVPYVTVATYNVDLKQYADESTVAAIGETGADVIVLQEVNRNWRRVLDDRYAELYPYRGYQGEASGGLAVLSKRPFEDQGVVPGIDGWHPAWHVLVESDLGPLQLLLVHLKPPYSAREGLGGYFDAETAHVREVSAFQAACDERFPTLILGDFNEAPDGEAIDYLEARGFANVLPQYRPGQETWRYKKSLYHQAIETIDHILYQRDAFAPLNAYVRYDGNSDHLPVIALFERRAPSE
jgi:endonuclease/exonuclease/phosphatase family metal-dependent hydrolase